jgi:hypothetical protein
MTISSISMILFLLFAGNIPPDYPTPPTTRDRLFYIQRNHNKNTIMYDANFDSNGILDKEKPINVYWIRYEEGGRRMDLRALEKRLAYGVKCKKLEGRSNQYKIKLVAYDEREFLLKQESPFKANLYGFIAKKQARLEYMYIFADNSSFIPDVKYVELYGAELGSGKMVYEKVLNE